jgi:hypothetical protein
MAPGLSEIRAIYAIESETGLAMTLSIFLLSFGIGVGLSFFPSPILNPCRYNSYSL